MLLLVLFFILVSSVSSFTCSSSRFNHKILFMNDGESNNDKRFPKFRKIVAPLIPLTTGAMIYLNGPLSVQARSSVASRSNNRRSSRSSNRRSSTKKRTTIQVEVEDDENSYDNHMDVSSSSSRNLLKPANDNGDESSLVGRIGGAVIVFTLTKNAIKELTKSVPKDDDDDSPNPFPLKGGLPDPSMFNLKDLKSGKRGSFGEFAAKMNEKMIEKSTAVDTTATILDDIESIEEDVPEEIEDIVPIVEKKKKVRSISKIEAVEKDEDDIFGVEDDQSDDLFDTTPPISKIEAEENDEDDIFGVEDDPSDDLFDTTPPPKTIPPIVETPIQNTKPSSIQSESTENFVPKRKNKRRGKFSKLFDDNEGTPSPASSTSTPISEIVHDDDDEDDLFDDIEDERVSQIIPSEVSHNADVDSIFNEDEDNDDFLLEETEGKVDEEAPKKKGILGRLFAKAGASRPTSLNDVLFKSKDEVKLEFQTLAARSLLGVVPSDVESAGKLLKKIGGAISVDEAIPLLNSEIKAMGMSKKDAAEAFASVANSIIVEVVDRASSKLGKGKKEEDVKAGIDALDDVAITMHSMVSIFEGIASGVKIEPVVYNGRTKKGKIEDLYKAYAKDSMSLGNLLGGLGLGNDNANDDNDDNDSDKNVVDSETKQQRLMMLQQIFGIREKKRESIEGKIMREMMMSMVKGEGMEGLGDLGGLMDSLGGLGGGDPGQMPDMEELMKSFGGDVPNMDGMPGMDGMNPDDMSPEEMQAMSADAMKAVKDSLQDGSITASDVAELEKIMGSNIEDLVGMLGAGNVDKAKLKELGPEFSDMFNVFKQLSDIKKNG